MFEEVPKDIDSFFETGEVPASLQAEVTKQAETPVDAPVEGATPPAETATPPADAPKADPAPAPATNPYADELIRQQQAKLDELTRTLNGLVAEKQRAAEEAAKPAPIDPKTDPLGYLTQQINAVGDQVKAMQQQTAQTTEKTAQEVAAQRFVSTVNDQVHSFEKDHTDYQDAYKHLIGLRTADYQLRGMTPDQIQQAIANEEIQIAQGALRQGKNVAEVTYALAQRYGYQAKTAPVTAPAEKAESKLDTIKKGMETSGVSERSSPPPTYSTDAIKSMSDAQFQDAVANHWDEMFGRPKGGGIFF